MFSLLFIQNFQPHECPFLFFCLQLSQINVVPSSFHFFDKLETHAIAICITSNDPQSFMIVFKTLFPFSQDCVLYRILNILYTVQHLYVILTNCAALLNHQLYRALPVLHPEVQHPWLALYDVSGGGINRANC